MSPENTRIWLEEDPLQEFTVCSQSIRGDVSASKDASPAPTAEWGFIRGLRWRRRERDERKRGWERSAEERTGNRKAWSSMSKRALWLSWLWSVAHTHTHKHTVWHMCNTPPQSTYTSSQSKKTAHAYSKHAAQCHFDRDPQPTASRQAETQGDTQWIVLTRSDPTYLLPVSQTENTLRESWNFYPRFASLNKSGGWDQLGWDESRYQEVWKAK